MELHLHVFTKKHVFNSKFATDVQALTMTWNYTPGTYPKNKQTIREQNLLRRAMESQSHSRWKNWAPTENIMQEHQRANNW